MAGEKEDPFATSVGALIVFKPFIYHYARDIFACVAGEQADFSQLPSQGDEFSAQQPTTLAVRHLRKCEREIAHPHTTQASVDRVDAQTEADPEGAGHGTRQQPQDFYPGPDERVLKAFSQEGSSQFVPSSRSSAIVSEN